MNFTEAQQRAIDAEGDTLVIAGAGTGKTRTLVERCVQALLNPARAIGLDEILVVTFTEAAAAEIRQRIRTRLEEELDHTPQDGRLTAHLAALDAAHISTLHSFCLELVRQHFHELEIDPQLSVLAEEQSLLLAEETLDALLERHYAGQTPEADRVRRFLRDYARSWETRVRQLILELHHFTQTRPDPEGWFEAQLTQYALEDPVHWRRWFLDAFGPWRADWLPMLAQQPEENEPARACAQALQAAGNIDPTRLSQSRNSGDAAEAFTRIRAALDAVLARDQDWPPRKKKAFREPIRRLFEEAAFLHSLCPDGSGADPLAEDWAWVRQEMTTLLGLAREFSREFAAAKRERGAVDFHDLEQFALRLLWEPATGQPTDLAREWQARLKLVFVDEYQDINEAQDTILKTLSRPVPHANRFLVGDVKQSIYRFRQAAPHIFQDYATRWVGSGPPGQSIYLSDNFRSREALLAFINPLFTSLMRREMGGVDYDEAAALRFGGRAQRAPLTLETNPGPRVECLLRVPPRPEDNPGDPDDSELEAAAEQTDAEAEAARLALRFKALREEGHQVWDPEAGRLRPVAWRDMVILLRSPRSKVDAYAKEFARCGVPLQAKRAGFFDSIEVQDLLNLLKLLDNPLQDVPTVAVLRSPLAGLSLDELAVIRLHTPRGRYWHALQRWHAHHQTDPGPPSLTPPPALDPNSGQDLPPAPVPTEAAALASDPDFTAALFKKTSTFLRRFERWRTQARRASLAQRLEQILTDTSYMDWLITQPRGEQRQANVAQLLELAREFDELHAQGLHRFLLMIEAQQETAGDREPAPLETGDAVRLMSIHQSKGLEFPVVAVADLGKRFNLADTRHGVLLDDAYGLCPQIRPPHTGQHYPSLPLWLARRHQRAEILGEEMRILYVALTRAQDTLILSGTCSARALESRWPDLASASPPARQLLQAGSYLDWIGPWLQHLTGGFDSPEGHPLCTCLLERDTPSPSPNQPNSTSATLTPPQAASEEAPADLLHRLQFAYPFPLATHAPAKSSVTALRRQLTAEDEEAQPARYLRLGRFEIAPPNQDRLGAAQIGQAHHRFLQKIDLARTATLEDLQAEAARLQAGGWISPQERAALNLQALTRFWQSEIGSLLRTHAALVQREWPFTCRLVADDLQELSSQPLSSIPPGEFVVVQGVADLVVLHPQETWLLDYKTDQVPAGALEEKVAQYRPQLELYRLAVGRLAGPPVTRTWLHFLALNQTVEINNPSINEEGSGTHTSPQTVIG